MPKQIDVKVTKPQNKHRHGGTRKCPILYSRKLHSKETKPYVRIIREFCMTQGTMKASVNRRLNKQSLRKNNF